MQRSKRIEKARPAHRPFVGPSSSESTAEPAAEPSGTPADDAEQGREPDGWHPAWIAPDARPSVVSAQAQPGERLDAPKVRSRAALVAIGVVGLLLGVAVGLGLWWLGNRYECSFGGGQPQICRVVAPNSSSVSPPPARGRAGGRQARPAAGRATDEAHDSEDANGAAKK